MFIKRLLNAPALSQKMFIWMLSEFNACHPLGGYLLWEGHLYILHLFMLFSLFVTREIGC